MVEYRDWVNITTNASIVTLISVLSVYFEKLFESYGIPSGLTFIPLFIAAFATYFLAFMVSDKLKPKEVKYFKS